MEAFGQEPDSLSKSKVVSFFGYILLFGGLFILWFAIQETRQAIEVKSWEERKSQIISSNVFFDRSGGEDGWRLIIRGRFLDDGKQFETSRIRFGAIKFASESNYKEYAAKFPPGSVHTVFVSPKDATHVVLLRSESPILDNGPLHASVAIILLSVLLLWISKKI